MRQTIAGLLLLLVLAGCGSPERSARRWSFPNPFAPKPGPPASEPAAVDSPAFADKLTQSLGGVTITLSLPPRSPGQAYTLPLEVQVLVENKGAEPVRWRGSSSCPDPTHVKALLSDGQVGYFYPVAPDGTSGPRACTEDL